MSTASSQRAGKRKHGSESDDADCESVQIDQLKQQVDEKDEKICQLKKAIDLAFQHLREVVDSPQVTLPSATTVPGKPSGKNEPLADDSPKTSTPDTASEPAPKNIHGRVLFPPSAISNSENTKRKRKHENGSNDRPGIKKPRTRSAVDAPEILAD